MKGPGARSKHDVRRVWECPVCKAQQRTPGSVVVVRCACGDGQTWMTLVEPGPKHRHAVEPPAAPAPE